MAFTSQEYAALWARRVGAVTPQVRATVRQFGRTLLATSEGYLHRDIYAIPEDVSPTGRPLWRRTNQLAARERIEYSGDGAGVRLLNDTPYAEPRHEAGKPGRRPTRRPAPWRDQALLAIQLVKPEMIAAMLDNIHAGNANGPIPQPPAPSGLPGGGLSVSGVIRPSARGTNESGGGGGGGGGSARRRLPRQPRRAKPTFNTRTHRRGH